MKKTLIYLTICTIIELILSLYLTEWRNVFWDVIAKKDYNQFWTLIGIFTGVALFLCLISGWSVYLIAKLGIIWREELNSRAVMLKNIKSVDNVRQRIQEDCKEYPRLMITLIFGTGKALAYVILFSLALIYLFSTWYLIVIFIYAIGSTWLAKKIALPLISLNYRMQRAEATYRENIFNKHFKQCISLMFGVAIKQKQLAYFQSFYGQIGVILPIILLAPAYFFSGLTLGGLMQGNSIMVTIVENSSYGINHFGEINQLLSCRKRLKEIGVI